MDAVIKNGVIVTARDIFKADLGILNGKISAVGEDLSGFEEIDATGKYVLPGVLDVQTHLEFSTSGTRTADNFFTGTRSAACGGVTTIIDFALQEKNETLTETIRSRRELADPQVAIDYALHLTPTRSDEETLQEIAKLILEGFPSLKLYLGPAYRRDPLMVDDGFLYAALQLVKQHGGMVGVHAENAALVDFLTNALISEELTQADSFPASRPNVVEAEATYRAIALTEAIKTSLFLFQVSTQEAMQHVAEARNRALPIFAGTSPHYLVLQADRYLQLDSQNYITSPPLRSAADVSALWKGIQTGDIQVVSSDHCPFTLAQKRLSDRFSDIPRGLPGVETLLPVLYTEGVVSRRITLNQMVALLSTNPAEIFGIPNKGSLHPGKDADIVIFNPHERRILTAQALHSEADFTPFEGWELQGYPEMTIARGRLIYDGGKFIGEKGMGAFVPRTLSL